MTTTTVSSHRVVRSPVGEIDLATADTLVGEVLAHSEGAREVIVDLSGVTFCDLAGVRALSAVSAWLSVVGVELVLTGATGGVARLLDWSAGWSGLTQRSSR